jgi:SSS family solute:Na+ symporter
MSKVHFLDIAVIVVYLGILTAIGAYFYRRQKSLDDFVKGGKEIGWFTIGISLMAALNSGIDFIQAPAMVYVVGLVFVTLILSWIPAYPWIAFVTLPFYKRLNVYSAYEYLERRFDVGVRTIASMIFILWRVGWMGAALYIPIKAFQGAFDLGPDYSLTWMIILLGTVVTTYTMLGGMKAVIWTDVTQFGIMFVGLATMLTIIIINYDGGIADMWRIVTENKRHLLTAQIPEMEAAKTLGAKAYHYFTFEVTAVGVIMAVTISRLNAFTCDQIAIQRFQATKTVKEARNAFIINAFSDSIWMIFLGFVGLALFAFYLANPMPEGKQNSDVVPYFLHLYFQPGLRGLVLAAITAASLSSVDAAINSTTSVIVVDFYNRLVHGRVRPAENMDANEQRHQVFVSRLVNVTLGIVMIIICIQIPNMNKSEIYQAINKILGAFFGPLFGIFLLGMFSKRARSLGVLVGAVCGLMTACFFSFFSELMWLQRICGDLFGPKFVDFMENISWAWPSPFGIAVVLIVGYGLSLLLNLILPLRKDEKPLTWFEVMKMPEPIDEPVSQNSH